MVRVLPDSKRRIVILTVVLALVGVFVATGPAAAHTPSCHLTAGADGPHYDDDPKTGSDSATENNPTLGDDFGNAAVESCSVGNSQSPRSGN
ncbi:hypothetical protein BRD00_11975 [Halobacteriales archaeon QS_8_69_26]|nr:MAG: hypothetical protein BRD00_11975 [Halobacteriales archaeon QS_8_69_26]